MGKYIRKSSSSRGGGTGTGTAPAVVVAGVRTRSRTAAAAAPAPKRLRKARAEVEVDEGRDEDGDCAEEGCCYLQLRSRRLFMVVAAHVAAASPETVPVAAAEVEEGETSPAAVPLAVTGSTASVEAVVVSAGASRCSSTASSVDAAALRERSGCAAEAREDCGEESSVSDSGCGRHWREATPSSRAPADHSDQESSKAADDPKHHCRRYSATTTTTVPCRARMPPAEEIEEFFATAEKAEAESFEARYNFDVVRGVPIDTGGRFEWTPVASG